MIRVRVPATVANLGPGFDVLGLALDLYNQTEVEPADGWSVAIEGEGAGQLPPGGDNLLVKAMLAFARHVGLELQPHRVTCRNRIPVGRGLGSSAAAIAAGMAAADAALGTGLTREEMLAPAVRMEGHGDNVSAALLGGLCIYFEADSTPRALRLEPADGLAVVLAVPSTAMPTSQARAVLPGKLSYADATFQMARVAMLAVAITEGRTDLLTEASSDRMHQPQRRRLEPEYDEAERALVSAGAEGVALCGAGPAVMGWTRAERASEVASKAEAAFAQAEASGATWRVVTSMIDMLGCQVELGRG